MSWVLQSTELEISLEGGKTFVFPPLELLPGELVLLQGNSGSGKSTWMHALAGLLPMRSGHVEITGHPIYHASSPTPRGWRRHALGLMPQRAFFWNSLSLHENLALTPAFSTVGMTDTSLRSWGDSGSLSGSRAFEVWREPCSIEISTTWNSTKAEYGGVAVVLQGSGNEDLVEPNNMFGYSCHFGTITVSAVMDTLTINRTVTCISPASQHHEHERGTLDRAKYRLFQALHHVPDICVSRRQRRHVHRSRWR